MCQKAMENQFKGQCRFFQFVEKPYKTFYALEHNLAHTASSAYERDTEHICFMSIGS